MQSIFQDLNARTSWGGFQQDLHKIFSQGLVRDHVRTPRRFHNNLVKSFKHGPVQDHEKASDNMSLGSPQDLLTRTCKRPWPRSSCQGPQEKLLLLERILQDLDTRTSQEHPRRTFIQARLRHGICKIFRNFSQWPLGEDLTRISTRSSDKDLCRIMQGPLRKRIS